MYDTWRATTGWTYAVVDLYPDEVGRMQYELYPAPTSEQGLPYLAFRTCPNLVNDDDTPPPCIPSHVLVNGAIADVLLLNPKSPYYSIPGSQYFGAMYDSGLTAAMLADDSVYMNNLQWAWSRYPYSQMGSAYWQQHDSDSVMGYV